MPLRTWPSRWRGRRCARPPLVQRQYRLVWHWRDDGPATLRRAYIAAPTVDHATAELRRKLGADYDNVATELAVIEAVPVEATDA